MPAFPVSPLASRERARRRQLLLGALVLLTGSVGPVFGHHLGRGAMWLLGGDRLGAVCLVALRGLLAPVHEAVHVLLIVGLVYASWRSLRSWTRARRTLRGLEWEPVSPVSRFADAAARAGIHLRTIRLVRGLPNPAFTIGLVRPVMYIAHELEQELSAGQLAMVLAHEAAHIRRRDPLRLWTLRFLANLLFWLPAFLRLAEDLADEAEILADDEAAGAQPLVLASAILAVAARGHGVPVPQATGFVCHGMLDRRVRRLAGEESAARSHLTRRSLAGAMAVLPLLWAAGIAMAHPLGAQGGARIGTDSCLHHSGSAITHLLCDGFRGSVLHCPHARR